MGIKVYRCDRILTPFLFGIVHPRIYIPMDMEEKNRPYIIRHEYAHKKRKDYLIKPAAFLLLGIHWFNPCIWLAYKLLGRDIELACDELVIRNFTLEEKKAYSTALLDCSMPQKKMTACQAFFGETNIKERVKNILSYKKPAFFAVALSILVCIILLLCFMTTRRNEALPEAEGEVIRNGFVSQTGQTVSGENGEGQEDEGGLESASAGSEQGERREEEMQAQADGQAYAEYVKQWTEAFCSRDGEKIYAMYSEEYKKNAGENEIMPTEENGFSFGWSSPWPWDDSQTRIVEVTGEHAEILYYAWVSDPHVTVWRQSLSYHMEGDKWLVDEVSTKIMEYMCVLEEFERAYPDGQINDTAMDYLKNGVGETLNKSALLSSSNAYRPLFAPDTAAVYLLNLLQNENKVEVHAQIEEKGGRARVTFQFKEDGNEAEVMMVQPYGENGIWIPQTYEES